MYLIWIYFVLTLISQVQNVLQTWFFNIFLDAKLIPKLCIHKKSNDYRCEKMENPIFLATEKMSVTRINTAGIKTRSRH